MARRKMAEGAQEEIETQVAEPAADAPQADASPSSGSPDEQPKRKFEPVRGWTSRFTGPVKYRKFTDANMHIIAFKFNVPANEKLPDDILAVMRDHKQDKDGRPTGLHFQDTRTHGKIWAIRNDIEGRALADKIDYRLSELAQKMEETQSRATS